MAPITSFLKVSRNSVLPLRIFTNRKELIKQQKESVSLFEAAISSSTTKNHRALVRLRSSSRVYLSNNQISQLVNDLLKKHLISLLFTDSIELLQSQSEKSGSTTSKEKAKDLLTFLINENGWKVRIYLSVKFILNLRQGIIYQQDDNHDSLKLLIRTPRKLDQKEQFEQEPVLLVEEDEDEDQLKIPKEGETISINNTDDKKLIQKYDYKKSTVLGKGIKIEVLQIPKRI